MSENEAVRLMVFRLNPKDALASIGALPVVTDEYMVRQVDTTTPRAPHRGRRGQLAGSRARCQPRFLNGCGTRTICQRSESLAWTVRQTERQGAGPLAHPQERLICYHLCHGQTSNTAGEPLANRGVPLQT